MQRLILLIVILSVLISCNNADFEKQKESELKKKESIPEAQELKLKENNNTSQNKSVKITADTTYTLKTDGLSDVENLIGYWFVPHAAVINIKFYKNRKFEFNDYNMKLKKDESLKGTYQLRNGILTLQYDDRPKQKFKFFKGEKGDENFYIKKTGYYFAKGE